MENPKGSLQDQLKKLQEKSVVKSESPEAIMNNAKKIVEQVKENVNTIVNVGKDAATNPHAIGAAVANTFNKIGNNKENIKNAVKNAFQLGYATLVEGAKEIKKGYTDTRNKPEIEVDENIDDTPPPDKSAI